MKVRLTRKYANRIDDVDLSEHQVGDVLDLSVHDASLLVIEQWAIPERRADRADDTGHRRRADDSGAESAQQSSAS